MQRNKLLKILLSTVIAFGLWLYVITVVSPGSEKTYYNIPVTFQNEDVLTERGLVITECDKGVTLTLEGNRIDLNNMNENNINILADVAGIMAPGEHKVRYTESFPGNIADNSIITKSKGPDLLTVKVENLLTKKVKIEYEALGNLPESYHPEAPVYSNNGQALTEIEVSGPESMVSKIEYAIIQVDFNGRTESITGELPYTLCDANRQRVETNPELVTTNAQAIRMDMKIHHYMELPLAVELINGGGATEENCLITITPVDKLTVSGEDRVMKNLEAIVIGTVDLATLNETTTLTLPLQMPQGVTNRTEGYDQVQVTIRLKGLQTKTLRVNQFRTDNQPMNMDISGIPTSLTVEVRGPADQIGRIKASDVTVVLDLKNIQPGVNPLPIQLEFADGFQAVGVLDKPEVIVTARAK